MSEVDDTSGGYLSEASKRRFTLTAGILGAAFLIGQFLLPMAMMVGVMARDIGDFNDDIRYAYPQRSAVLDNTLYYVAHQRAFGAKARSSTILQVDLALTRPPVPVVTVPDAEVSLLAGPDRLWVITREETNVLMDGALTPAPHGTELAEFTAPFLFQGRPAVLERWPTSLVLATHGDDGWRRGPSLPLVLPDPECGCGLGWARAIAGGDALHVFLELGSTLYYGLWDPTSEAEVQWSLVGDSGSSWWPLLDDGRPVVFRQTSRDDDSELVGLRLEDGIWREFFRGGDARGRDIAAHPLPEPGAYLVLAGSGFNSEIQAIRIEGSLVAADSILGDQIEDTKEAAVDNFESRMMWVMAVQYSAILLLPLLLAVILSFLMRRHRIPAYRTEGREANHASLTRRAIAQLIDVVLLVAAPALGMALTSSPFWNATRAAPEGFWDFLGFTTPVLAGVGISILVFFAFAYSEGRRGVTPGKWATRIRVLGTDLEPCGFSRALVRNFLKVIDGFFNFMVGIMVVALSENWQRVGDMAARTVVVAVDRR
jgi:uncharacterized RDD family membrane protein YckC